tara:strand:+ start:745 stop:924 length:180 start_codon:yes stop_codon:yes gene_type:complete
MLNVSANPSVKRWMVGLTILATGLSIIVAIKNLRSMKKEEEDNATRLTILEEQVKVLQG